MPVTSKHPQYVNFSSKWQKCRDCVDGEEAVKARGEQYVPMLSGMDSSEFSAYITRAEFYNASSRTVMGLSGFVFRKDPDLTVPDDAKVLVNESIGTEGEGIKALGQFAIQEVLTTGREGYLIDSPLKAPGASTNPYPYISIYFAENITNWGYTWIEGKKTLTKVVLHETVDVPDPDDSTGFGIIQQEQFRVLKLSQQPDDNGKIVWMYQQQIWVEKDEPEQQSSPIPTGFVSAIDTLEDDYELSATITPRAWGGRILDSIPFVFQNPVDTSEKVYNPPILDLVNTNLSHYRSSADLEHGRHYTALPTAWASGFKDPGQKMVIGSSQAWVTEEPNANCGFLEFKGQGLGSLENALEEKEKHMAVLGARILDEGKKEAEAAETVEFRHAGEQNTLSVVVGAVDEGLTKALKLVAEWMNLDSSEVRVRLNRDFGISGMEPGMLIGMLQAWQNGAMSFDSFFYGMQRGQMYPEGWTIEQERSKIATGKPIPLPGKPLEDVPNPGGPGQNKNTALTAGL